MPESIWPRVAANDFSKRYLRQAGKNLQALGMLAGTLTLLVMLAPAPGTDFYKELLASASSTAETLALATVRLQQWVFSDGRWAQLLATVTVLLFAVMLRNTALIQGLARQAHEAPDSITGADFLAAVALRSGIRRCSILWLKGVFVAPALLAFFAIPGRMMASIEPDLGVAGWAFGSAVGCLFLVISPALSRLLPMEDDTLREALHQHEAAANKDIDLTVWADGEWSIADRAGLLLYHLAAMTGRTEELKRLWAERKRPHQAPVDTAS